MDESSAMSATQGLELRHRTYGEVHPPMLSGQVPRYRVHDYGRDRVGAEEPFLHPTRTGCSDIIILARGARVRVRPEHGAIWVAVGSGLQCAASAYDAWCSRGTACVTEARQEVTITAPECQDSIVVGILPDKARLEHASTKVSGSGATLTMLFPEVEWRRDLHAGLPCHAIAQWRKHDQESAALGSWADSALSGCLAHQSNYRPLVSRCSGRSWQQKQVMLCRLLRGRIAMQCQDDPTVTHGANAALLSAWRFIALHREVFGETPARSAYHHRLEQALHQLKSGDLAVMDVAEIVGYRNRSSFSRAFKSRFGYSPAEASQKLRRS